MRRFGWLVSLASLVVLGGVDRAQASPLTLAFSGSAYASHLYPETATSDVTNGFSGISGVWGALPLHNLGEPQAVNSSIDIEATLSDADRILATVQFSAPVTGTITWDAYDYHPESNTASGSAVGVVTVAQGVDPSLIPPWLTGMTATVYGWVSGSSGVPGSLQGSTLTISADPAPVPEPSSVLVFLAAAGFVGLRRLRNG